MPAEYASNAPLARFDDPLNLPQNEGLANNAEQEKRHQAELRDFQAKMGQKRARPMSAGENAAQNKEENDSAVKGYRYIDQGELEVFCQGNVLSHQQFMAKLQLIRPDAFYNDFSRMGRIGINIVELGQAKYTGTTVQFGLSPEFSQVRVNAHGVGEEEKYRGWRTTLG